MKFSFNVGWWVNIKSNEYDIILETTDGNGNEIEMIFDKKGIFAKRHFKQFVKDLETLKEVLKNNG